MLWTYQQANIIKLNLNNLKATFLTLKIDKTPQKRKLILKNIDFLR